MLLSLFRLTMIVPLLVSAFCIEVNSEKLSFVPSEKEKAVAEISSDRNAFIKEESAHNRDEVQKRQLNKNNGHSSQHESKRRSLMENRVPRLADGNLAQKMAKDALKSPKMQQTMHKLIHGNAPRKNLYATVKLPAPTKSNAKLTEDEKKHGNPVKRKGRKKKKRKRHHRRFRKQHDPGLRGGSSKRPLNIRGRINARKLNERKNSIIKRNQAITDHKSRARPSTSKSNEKVIAVKVDDSDYIDFSSPLGTESTVLFTRAHEREGSVKLHENENMIERLMRTTTKDPSKKSLGDQGVEYSDYYSEDDVLQDIAANKIPVGVAETKNDRFTRQTINSTSFYDNQLEGNFRPYYQDYDARGKGFRYTDDSLDNPQNYPPAERLPELNRNFRLRGADELSYVPNYRFSEDRRDNLEPMYPASTEEIVEPQLLEQVPDNSDPQNSLELSDPSNLNVEDQPQDPDRFNYLNQYEIPQEERLRNLDANEAQDLNLNEDIESPNLRFPSSNPVVEVPEFSNKFNIPETENLYNHRRTGTNWQHLVDRNTINLPRVGNTKPLGLQGEVQDQAQVKSFPVQARSKYYENSNNLPSVNAPNAMNLPLGKVLESLGINVNADSSGSDENSNLKERLTPFAPVNSVIEKNNPNSVSETLDRPMERVLSPSYLKKNPREDWGRDNEAGNARGLDFQGLRVRNENSNLREGYTRRQSSQSGLHSDNSYPFADEDQNAGHRMNISIAVHDTKEVANQILDTIMDELEELKLDHAKNNKREGSWSTAQAGMKLDMKVVNHSIIVTMSDLASPRFHESLLNGTWNISGHAPFKRGSPFTLTATDNYTNSVAVFVGACRVCQGIDTIAGVWSVARQPKDCKDLQVATSVFNDIFHKTKLSSLKEKQGTAAENATGKKAKRGS